MPIDSDGVVEAAASLPYAAVPVVSRNAAQ
jgi:hypothetical protein